MNFVDERLLPRYFDRANVTIDALAWARLRSDTAYCQVRFDQHVTTPAGVICAVVSRWAGVNLAPFADGTEEPLIFETTIFGGPYDLHGRYYATEAAARAGHVAAVTDLHAGREPWSVKSTGRG